MKNVGQEIGTYTRVFYEPDGDSHDFSEFDYDYLRSAFKNWVEKGIDTLIELETCSGFKTCLPASSIVSMSLLTPEARKRVWDRGEMFDREEKAFKPWSPDAD